jgi:hypothetical protein
MGKIGEIIASYGAVFHKANKVIYEANLAIGGVTSRRTCRKGRKYLYAVIL